MGSFWSSLPENPVHGLIFLPHPAAPNQVPPPNVRFLTSANGKQISLMLLRPTTPSDRYIIWSHGNGADILSMESYLRQLVNRLQVNVVCYDYQGYLFSEGSPTESTCYQDHEAVVEYVIKVLQVAPHNITLVGHSIGTGIVVDYVVKHAWSKAILLISPYKSIVEIASDRVTCGSSLEFSLRPLNCFRSLIKMPQVRCPVKIIHGLADELIPVQHGQDLHSVAVNALPLVLLPETGHNNILGRITDEMYQEVFSH